MTASTRPAQNGRLTRGGFLRAALGGGAVVAGGAALGARAGSPQAAPSREGDADILNVFLALEYAQEDFYRAALEADALDAPLREYAAAVAPQEGRHVAFLRERLGQRAKPYEPADPGDAVRSAARFRAVAIRMEEATIGAYIGQGANLTPPMLAAIAPLVSVEARQVAWIRDLEGISPAPNAADPGRSADAVLADLRSGALLR